MWQGNSNKMCQIMYKIEVKQFLIIPQDSNSEIIKGKKKQGALLLPSTTTPPPTRKKAKQN